MLRTVLLKSSKQSTYGEAQNQVALMSLFLLSRILHHPWCPADSALLGAEHLGWLLAPTRAAETQQQRARHSCQPHSRYAICPDWNHLGCIRLGNLSSLLAYLLFIQGECRCNKSYTLDCSDKIVYQNLGWSLLSQY